MARITKEKPERIPKWRLWVGGLGGMCFILSAFILAPIFEEKWVLLLATFSLLCVGLSGMRSDG